MVSSCEKSARSKVVDSQAYFLVVFLELRIVLEVVCRYFERNINCYKALMLYHFSAHVDCAIVPVYKPWRC
jgi:hypothetical protein